MKFSKDDKVTVYKIPLGNGLEVSLCSSRGLYYFKSSELQSSKECKQNNIYNKGEENMNKIIGNYRVAKVRFLQGSNTHNTYNYALFDNEIQQYDNCVVKSANHGLGIAVIEEIIDDVDNISVTDNYGNIREIVCKIDMSAFNKRIDDRLRASQLKKEMDKKVKELQGLALYKMMAESSPELKAMLSEYEKLVNNG